VKNIQSACPDLMPYINITSGNVWEGVDEGGFDVIHVGAAAAKLPEVLVTALNKGGRMVIPVGGQNDVQVMQVVDRLEDGSIKKQDLMAVRYVPLTRPGEDDLYY
jgi:protein-L-isoaspartate(D-aspartate) O-methyltransferase